MLHRKNCDENPDQFLSREGLLYLKAWNKAQGFFAKDKIGHPNS
jgi:hypothetical protein